ncbi:MAG TPA: PQQ-dependent sugar dehydrogenase [Thermoanaerobaculia bacterium]|nr:PQQ-dependent sugar dehydrogenase [Thermoanaerobaculia bacterium]
MAAAAFLGAAASASAARRLPLDRIRLPPGFHIDVYADPVPRARSMALAPSGTVFVGTSDGNVYALRNRTGAPKAEQIVTVARDLHAPNGVAVRDGALYVAEISRIWRFDDIEKTLEAPRRPSLVTKALPPEEGHGLKVIRFGPDGQLYFGIGVPCNVCEKPDPYGTIMRMHPDGSGLEVFARGIRNSVGFDWDPASKELWFTDNGRDWLGDDAPPDELNRAPRAGMNFGFPYCHGGSIPDPDLGGKHPCSQFTPPEQKLGAHVASLGMRFYAGAMFPPEYRGRIFIAEHGSWNRSRKAGYRVTTVTVKNGRAAAYAPFAEGWLEGEHAWGRPVDVLVMPDGSLLVSDDQAGAIYRISYSK